MTAGTMTESEDRVRLEASLRRIEELVSDLDRVSDPAAREHARELLETVLDVHGLAMARMIAVLARADGGADLLHRLGRDEQVRTVLLLHGLHPEELDTRVRRAIDGLRPSMRSRGVDLHLMGLSRGSLELRVRRRDAGTATDASLREDIEAALLEAAPDLDAVHMRFEEGPSRAHAPAGVTAC